MRHTQLCKDHRVRYAETEYATGNCDMCKLNAEITRLREERSMYQDKFAEYQRLFENRNKDVGELVAEIRNSNKFAQDQENEIARLRGALAQIANDSITFDEQNRTREGTRFAACQAIARAALEGKRGRND